VKISVKTDTSDLRAKLREFELVVGREMSGAVRQFARKACVYLANATQPYSGKGEDGKSQNKQAKALGEKAVQVDISKVFYTPQSGGFARAVKKVVANSKRSEQAKVKFNARLDRYISSNNKVALTKIVKDFNWQGVIDNVDPALHQKARSGSRRKVDRRRQRKKMHMVLGGRGEISSYIKTVQKRVGIAKSGWASCAQKISVDQKQSSTAGIPAWVTRHAGGNNGSIVDQSRDKRNPRVTMTNNVPWTSQVLSDSAKKESLRLAKENFLKYMDTTIRAELRRQRLQTAA
jgi:hypothetical protein